MSSQAGQQTADDLSQASKSLGQVVKVLHTTSTAVGQVAQSVSSAGKAAAAAAKTAKSMKGQIRDLFSFDQINRLSSVATGGSSGSKSSGGGRKSSGSGGGGGGSTASAVKETVGWLDQLKKRLAELIQPLQRFWNMNGGNTLKAFHNLAQAAGELGDLLKGALNWGYENVLVPLGKWTLNSLVPAVLNDLAAAVRVVSAGLRVLQPLALGIWNQVLKPLAAWSGARLVDALNVVGNLLNGLANKLNSLAQFISSGSILSQVETFGVNLVRSIGNGVTKAKETLKLAVQGLIQKVVGEVNGQSSLNPVKLAVKLATAAVTLWSNLRNAWNALGTRVSVDTRLSKTGATLWSGFKASWGSRSVSIYNSLSKKASTLWSSFKAGWGTRSVSIRNVLASSASSLWNGFKRGWSGKSLRIKLSYVTQGISSLQRIAYRVLGLSGWPKLTFAAKGGVFSGPTLTMLGEAGKEAVVPLERNTGWMDQLAQRIVRQSGGATPGGGGQSVTVYCVLDGKVIAQNTIQYINGKARTTGVNPLSAYL